MRFLLVTPIYTASRVTGGGQRTILLYRALLRLGKVDIALISEEVCRNFEKDLAGFRDDFPEAQEISIIRSTAQFMFNPTDAASRMQRVKYQISRFIHVFRPRSHFYRPSTEAKAMLGSLLARNGYDAIVGRYLQATALSGAFCQVRVPTIVDLDDLDEIVLTSRLGAKGTSGLRKSILRLHLWQTIPIVRRLRNKCRYLLVSSADDLPLLRDRPATVLPNIPFPRAEVRPIDEDFSSKTVLFVGSFGHRVNREGVEHFAKHCWPLILQQIPEARFRIVGSGGWESLRGEFDKIFGLEIIGKVDDLGAAYRQAAICISPIFEGAGTKIKILESLMYSRVVIAAAFSVRGFDESTFPGVLSASSDEQMISHCVFMINNPALRGKMSAESRTMVAKKYSFDFVCTAVEKAFERMQMLESARCKIPQ